MPVQPNYRFTDGSSIPFSDIPKDCCPHTPAPENRFRRFSTRAEFLRSLTSYGYPEEEATILVDSAFARWAQKKAEAVEILRQLNQEERRQREPSSSTSNPRSESAASSGSTLIPEQEDISQVIIRPARTLDELERILPPGRVVTEPLPRGRFQDRAREWIHRPHRNFVRDIASRARGHFLRLDKQEDEELLIPS